MDVSNKTSFGDYFGRYAVVFTAFGKEGGGGGGEYAASMILGSVSGRS